MDWDLGQSDLTEHDKSNFSFYSEEDSVVVRKFGDDDEVSSSPPLRKKTEPSVDPLGRLHPFRL
jgi:hypothetical protein